MRSTVCHTTVMREILRKMASMPGHHDEHMGYGNLDPWRLFKYGPDHFRQVVEEIVGPLPVSQQFAAAQPHPPGNKRERQRRASDSEVELHRGSER
ncbi:PREDICTED: uncharacterized protein LOC109464823 isoform X2 [Branchiostoma belcheri]|nr:PREDICTED: uncharacterized protein LOC109464823 isoform X2 [Branchiostoma belcheri]